MAESALSRSVAELRRSLGDNAAEPIFIETITKRGYRLVARVEHLGGRTPDRASAEPPAPVHPAGPPPAHTCSLCWGEQEIPLSEGENVVGRTADALVRISSSRVSRRHARIVLTGTRAVLEDLGSKNGTYLRGRRIEGPVELLDGAEICFGHEVVVFRFCDLLGTTMTDGPG